MYVDAAYCYRPSVVCGFVTIVRPAKTVEPIDMTFGLWTGTGPGKHVLDGVGTLAQPGEYGHVRRWCGLFVNLL